MHIRKSLPATLALSAMTMALTGSALADQLVIIHPGRAVSHQIGPKFAIIKRLPSNVRSAQPAAFPPTWTYTLTNGGKNFSETFIGTNPTGGASTTVPVYIIPVKLVSGSTTEDPTVVTQNGVSVVQNVLNSPLFNSSITYTQGGTALGTTQYEDAFQRATLWGTVSSHTGYHILLGKPTVEPLQTLTLTSRTGSVQNPFGNQKVIVANINTYDAKITSLISSLGIPANAFPLFVTVNSYLYQTNYASGCCIGGYHSVTSAGQPYGTASYVTQTGNFSQDVSAFSHELGEWIDDPSTNNPVPAACGSGAVLEVGDPLEGESSPAYGDYAYTVSGVTWHLQDLATLEYFGAPANTSVNNWNSFQGANLPFCSQGG